MKKLFARFKGPISVIFATILFLPAFELQGKVASSKKEKLVVGSKKFTESYILGEITAQYLESKGYKVERKLGLGGTLVAYQALLNNAIDIYPEYTGTIAQVILKNPSLVEVSELNKNLIAENVELLEPFGFNNTYVLATSQQIVEKYKVSKISDLRGLSLRGSFGYEFLEREDGWQNLKSKYKLEKINVKAMEHELAYSAIESGASDLIVAYTTDAKVDSLDLVFLEDDLSFFPKYFAAPFVTKSLPEEVKSILRDLSGKISDKKMLKLNVLAQEDGFSFAEVAQTFLLSEGMVSGAATARSRLDWKTLARRCYQHLYITFIAILMAIVLAVPLGIALEKSSNFAEPIMTFAGLLQTIPSIALLAFMIPIFGIGTKPAIMGLFLYSILPILRNTYVAIKSVEPHYIEAAQGIGLSETETLFLIKLRLGLPVIIAGIRTAAVINIGTATLAAFIGAGGLGEPIVTGLALNDTPLILQGAIPAAMLAVVAELFFARIEKATSVSQI